MTTENNNLNKSGVSSTIKINFFLLYSAVSAGIAWAIWPETLRGYGLGMISIILWFVAFASLMQAFKTMLKTYKRDKTLATYMKQGEKPKSSTLASDEALKDAGMR